MAEDLVLQIKGGLKISLGEDRLENLRCLRFFKNRLEGIFEDYELGKCGIPSAI